MSEPRPLFMEQLRRGVRVNTMSIYEATPTEQALLTAAIVRHGLLAVKSVDPASFGEVYMLYKPTFVEPSCCPE